MNDRSYFIFKEILNEMKFTVSEWLIAVCTNVSSSVRIVISISSYLPRVSF